MPDFLRPSSDEHITVLGWSPEAPALEEVLEHHAYFSFNASDRLLQPLSVEWIRLLDANGIGQTLLIVEHELVFPFFQHLPERSSEGSCCLAQRFTNNHDIRACTLKRQELSSMPSFSLLRRCHLERGEVISSGNHSSTSCCVATS